MEAIFPLRRRKAKLFMLTYTSGLLRLFSHWGEEMSQFLCLGLLRSIFGLGRRKVKVVVLPYTSGMLVAISYWGKEKLNFLCFLILRSVGGYLCTGEKKSESFLTLQVFRGYFSIGEKKSQSFYASVNFRSIGGNFPTIEKKSQSFMLAYTSGLVGAISHLGEEKPNFLCFLILQVLWGLSSH